MEEQCMREPSYPILGDVNPHISIPIHWGWGCRVKVALSCESCMIIHSKFDLKLTMASQPQPKLPPECRK